ncbi:hypothetical protein D9M71_197430 [compost metagenome]
MRRPHHQITFLTNPQAQVHLVEGVRQALLVQATDGVKDRFAHHQAHLRHRRVVLLQRQPVQVTFGVVFFTNKG